VGEHKLLKEKAESDEEEKGKLKEILEMREGEKEDYQGRMRKAKQDLFEAKDQFKEAEKVETAKEEELKRADEELGRARTKLRQLQEKQQSLEAEGRRVEALIYEHEN